MTPGEASHPAALKKARDEFVMQWGAIGSAWGINRTMAQIHALLMTTTRPLSTDEVMEDLQISRGNAHGNLRELVSWGLVRSVVRKGERKSFSRRRRMFGRCFASWLASAAGASCAPPRRCCSSAPSGRAD